MSPKTRHHPAGACASALLMLLFLAQGAAAQSMQGRFPDTPLITQNGKKVRFYDDLIRGKIVAIDFIYTSCGYFCPLETARMAQVQKKLGKRVGSDIFFYSISLDPKHDTPKVLRAYMKKFQVGPGWTFLTGNEADIVALEKRVGMYYRPSPDNPDRHLPHLLIGNDATGQWMQGNAMDNPDFQARMIGEFLDNFKHSNLAAEAKTPGDGHPLTHFDRGQYLFGRYCVACHTIGHGDRVGPDLLGVTGTRDPQWLARMIQTPDELIRQGDPQATALLKKYKNVPMPHLGITNDELNSLLGYLKEQAAAHDRQVQARAAEDSAKTSSRAGAPENK